MQSVPTIAEKLTLASPKVRGDTSPSPSDSAAGIGLVLIDPVARPEAVRSTRSPQQGVLFAASQSDLSPVVTHTDRNSCGLVPPCVRSYWISRSPLVRTGVTPFDERVSDWLNSKSMFVVPVGSWTRCQNICRKSPPAASSRYVPNVSRSLLLGGMLPLTTEGTAVSSFEPWPNESSPPPLSLSLLRASATPAQSIDGAASSTFRFASVSISKLLPGRLTSGWFACAGPAAHAVSTSAAAATPAKTGERRRR